MCKNRQKCNRSQATQEEWDDADVNVSMTMYSNAPEPVKMRGVERSAVRRRFRLHQAVVKQEHTSQPTNQASNEFGAGDVRRTAGVLLTLDSGVRLLDETLTLGGVVKYTGKAVRLSPDSIRDENEQLMKGRRRIFRPLSICTAPIR